MVTHRSDSAPAAEAEVFDTPRRDRRGRQVLGEERWTQLLADFDRSGLTQRAFAEREGIRYPTLVSRLVRRRREGSDAGSVAATPEPSRRSALGFAEMLMPASAATPLEVQLPDGVVVRGGSPAALAELVRALRQG